MPDPNYKEELQKKVDEFKNIDENELKKQFDQLKSKLEKLKKKVIEKFDKYIIGISVMPPPHPPILEGLPQDVAKEEKLKFEQEKNKIQLLVLVDDEDSKKMSKAELADKLNLIIDKFADEIDKNIKPQVMLMSELREVCYDAKYDLLTDISNSFAYYDPKDIFAALRVSNFHKNMVIKKFEKYIVSYVAAGSLFRGEKSNDIDVFVVVDDTDVKKMSRLELKDRLGAIIRSMGFEASEIAKVKKAFHIQVYILTDFWESIKDAHPVIFTLLRDGVPLYDRGVFMPWKLLLKTGRIRPSAEAIDMQMDIGERLLERARNKLIGVIGDDLYYAILNPAQAALMLYGVNPPTPKETIELLDEIFVKKEKLLEKKYVNILEKVRDYYKDIEHGKLKEVKGADIDTLLKEAKDYLDRIKKLFEQIQKKRGAEDIIEIHNASLNVAIESLSTINIKANEKNVIDLFKKNLVDTKKVPERFLEILKQIMKAKKDYLAKKLSNQEAEKAKREARVFIKGLFEYVQRTHQLDVERAKIRIKYGNKFGEIILLDSLAFITKDIDSKDKDIHKAAIEKDGTISKLQKSSQDELDDALKNNKPSKHVSFNEVMFDKIKEIFGNDAEILVS